jgi:hypothetical protein
MPVKTIITKTKNGIEPGKGNLSVTKPHGQHRNRFSPARDAIDRTARKKTSDPPKMTAASSGDSDRKLLNVIPGRKRIPATVLIADNTIR